MPRAVIAIVLLLLSCVVFAAEPPLIIEDFSKDKLIFDKSDAVLTTLADGKTKGLQLKPKSVVQISSLPADWSKHDVLRIQVFNPTDKPVPMYVQLRDEMQGPGYWAWHNRYTACVPGESTVNIAVSDLWRGEILRHDVQGNLDPKKMKLMAFSADAAVVITGIRVEAFSTPKVEVKNLRAFDVGAAGTPGFPGFTPLTQKDMYDKSRGFGWTGKPVFMRMDDRVQPDNLYRDSLSCGNADLSIDVPNGKYRVHLQLEDPGYWELMQNYTHRSVSAEGKVVVDQKMDAAEFKQRYFRNQDAEDFPGDDPFEKYVETHHPWTTFDVDVADGQLNLHLESPDAYANVLSAIILYPVDQADAGAKFLAYVKELRRFDWSQNWKPFSKAPTTPAFAGKMEENAKANGYVLYALSPWVGAKNYTQFPYDYTPTDADKIETLSATLAQGEYESVTFGLRPGRALGKVEVSVSTLQGPGGAQLGGADVSVRVGRYRFTRYSGAQSGLYSVNERELRLFNRTAADELRIENTMARRFWITVHAPANAAPGTYEGKISIKAEKGGARELPLRVTVLPFKLPEPRHLFAMYGAEVCIRPYYKEIQDEYPKLMETVYRDLSEHGINYQLGLNVKVAWQNGKAVITNEAGIEAELALLRKYGFKDGPVFVDGGCNLDQIASGGQIKGVDRATFIQNWHKEITDIFKARNWPKPAFCYGDEPNIPETLNKLTAANKAVHAVSPDIWMGIAYHIQNAESRTLMETLDVHHLKDFCPDQDFLEAKKHGKFLLNCNVGMDRLPFGLREWRSAQVRKTDGCITYSYTGNHVDIYYDLDGREDDYNCAPLRSDGTLDTTCNWERIREGVDDFRYAQALQDLSESTAAPKASVDAAAALLKEALEIGSTKGAEATGRAAKWREETQKVLTAAMAK